MRGSIFSIVAKVLRYKEWATDRFLFAMHHNETNNMTPSYHHLLYASLSDFWQTLCSSDESVQIKHFKHDTFMGMCSRFTWFNLEIFSKCKNVRYRKNQMFLWLTINSQSKLKKFNTLFLRYKVLINTRFLVFF